MKKIIAAKSKAFLSALSIFQQSDAQDPALKSAPVLKKSVVDTPSAHVIHVKAGRRQAEKPEQEAASAASVLPFSDASKRTGHRRTESRAIFTHPEFTPLPDEKLNGLVDATKHITWKKSTNQLPATRTLTTSSMDSIYEDKSDVFCTMGDHAIQHAESSAKTGNFEPLAGVINRIIELANTKGISRTGLFNLHLSGTKSTTFHKNYQDTLDHLIRKCEREAAALKTEMKALSQSKKKEPTDYKVLAAYDGEVKALDAQIELYQNFQAACLTSRHKKWTASETDLATDIFINEGRHQDDTLPALESLKLYSPRLEMAHYDELKAFLEARSDATLATYLEALSTLRNPVADKLLKDLSPPPSHPAGLEIVEMHAISIDEMHALATDRGSSKSIKQIYQILQHKPVAVIQAYQAAASRAIQSNQTEAKLEALYGNLFDACDKALEGRTLTSV